MSSTETVFVTNRATTHVYDSAMKYGALRFVTAGNYPIFKTTRLQEEIISALVYSKNTDYLLFSGSAFVSALCMTVWMELHKNIKVLLWDRTQDKYVMRELTRQGLRLEIETLTDTIQRSTGRLLL